jgi:uncharacterized protein
LTYLDTSILLSLLVEDSGTDRARAWFLAAKGPMVVSDLAALEVAAVLSRFLRTGRLSAKGVTTALRDFDDFRDGSEHLSQRPADFALAERLARDLETMLGAPDALHLASAINAQATLATFDLRLAEAARRRGADVAKLG